MYSLWFLLICVIFLTVFLQSDEDKANFQKLMEAIKKSKKGKTLGVFPKDNYPGQFMDAWRAVLKKEDLETVCTCSIIFLFSTSEFIMGVTYLLAYVRLGQRQSYCYKRSRNRTSSLPEPDREERLDCFQ